MKLLRHTNLRTTTGYLRTVEDRMRAAVENLGQGAVKTSLDSNGDGVNSVQILGAATGGDLGAKSLPKTDQVELRAKLAQLTKLLIANGFFDDNENSKNAIHVRARNSLDHLRVGLQNLPRRDHTGGLERDI